MDRTKLLENPYRPGAGHLPPFLAGRTAECDYFKRLLRQPFVTQNILVTGLRGMGKTVLVEHLRQMAESEGWLWVGNDLSESASLSEERLALRVLTDLASALSRVREKAGQQDRKATQSAADSESLDVSSFDALKVIYEKTPGLPSDRLKSVLQRVGAMVGKSRGRGIILAYDEGQCLADRAEQNEFPLSMLIETVSSLQKREGVTPYLLILSGLPQILEALTSARTYTERMFQVMTLQRLSRTDAHAAIMKPIAHMMPPLYVTNDLIDKVVDLTGGYPYLIQFFGREFLDQLLQNGGVLQADQFPSPQVMDRLDAGLFAARWNRTTDKQREFLKIIAMRGAGADPEFSAQEIAQLCDGLANAYATQMLQSLCERGMVYRARHGKYAFTVPFSEQMILRRLQRDAESEDSWSTSARQPPEPEPAPKREAPRGLKRWFR